MSLALTKAHTSARVSSWEPMLGSGAEMQPVVDDVVVVVTLMHVLTVGGNKAGALGAMVVHTVLVVISTGFGSMGPQAGRGFLNSTSHSTMALRSARRGWYIRGERVLGTSSAAPSSVSISSLISAVTGSSVTPHKFQLKKQRAQNFSSNQIDFNYKLRIGMFNKKLGLLKLRSTLPSMLHRLH